MKDLFNHLQLVPGKLKFIDERKPDGEAVAVPTACPVRASTSSARAKSICSGSSAT